MYMSVFDVHACSSVTEAKWGYQVSCFIISALFFTVPQACFLSFSTPSLPSEQAPAIPSPISHRLMGGLQNYITMFSVLYKFRDFDSASACSPTLAFL